MSDHAQADSEVLAAFAARVHDICDDMSIAPGRGRQTALAAVFGVNPKAARKWLMGIGYPEMVTAVRMANWADVNLLWLLQGAGPKRGNRVEGKALVLDEALRSLPPEMSVDLIDNIRAKLVRVGKIAAEATPNRYKTMLEAYEREFNRDTKPRH